jgi:hypothetical protein
LILSAGSRIRSILHESLSHSDQFIRFGQIWQQPRQAVVSPRSQPAKQRLRKEGRMISLSFGNTKDDDLPDLPKR